MYEKKLLAAFLMAGLIFAYVNIVGTFFPPAVETQSVGVRESASRPAVRLPECSDFKTPYATIHSLDRRQITLCGGRYGDTTLSCPEGHHFDIPSKLCLRDGPCFGVPDGNRIPATDGNRIPATDGNRTDGNRIPATDGNRNPATDGNRNPATDGNRTDGNRNPAADGNRTDGNRADGNRNDGNRADGNRNPADQSSNRKAGAYHVCRSGEIAETKLCPSETPFFDAGNCVASNFCDFVPNHWKYDRTDTSYFECVDGRPLVRDCPNGQRFSVNRCVAEDRCKGLPDGTRFKMEEDVASYWECLDGVTRKRKCPSDEVFSSVELRCIKRSRCFGRGGENPLHVAFDNAYLKRTRKGIRCGDDGEEFPVTCPGKSEVFDESTGRCREMDLCRDLKPDRVFPLDEYHYGDCRSSKKTVDFGFKVDYFEGTIRSVCVGARDGTKFGSPDLRERRKYIECLNEKPVSKICGTDYIFGNGDCEFNPCFTKDAGTCQLVDTNSYYYCRDVPKFTFIYDCPVGSRPDVSKLHCVAAAPQKNQRYANNAPIYIDKNSYIDEYGKTQVCGGAPRYYTQGPFHQNLIYRVVGRSLFRCVDEPCSNVNRFSWPLVPIDKRQAYTCLAGRVEKYVRCGEDQVLNYEKILKGNYKLKDCVPSSNEQSETFDKSFVRFDQSPPQVAYFVQHELQSINEDRYPETNRANVELYQVAEQLYEPLDDIVSEIDPIPPFRVNDCSGGETGKVQVKGYPRLFYDCGTHTSGTCPEKQIFIQGVGCTSVNVYPVFSNCKVFALGLDYTRDYRIFRCPEGTTFSYLKNQCVSSGLPGEFLCENFFLKHYEMFSKPSSDRLEPVGKWQ